MLRLTAEYMADVGWWMRYVQQHNIMEGERMVAPFYRFVKQAPERKWFSNASHEAIGGLCLETGVHWRYQLTEEVQLRTVRSKRGKGDRISINVLGLMAMVMTAYVMRGDKPDREWAKEGRSESRSTDEDIGTVGNEGGMVLSGKIRDGGR